MAATSSNNAPTVRWFKTDFGAIERHRLHVDGRETPYFVDKALMRCHYTYGEKYGLYGAGMSERGTAIILGFANKITVLKHRAEQFALERM